MSSDLMGCPSGYSSNLKAEPATTEAKKEDRPKSPGLLAKLLAPFKHSEKPKEKKVKEKSPKDKKAEKKEEVSCNVFVWSDGR